MRSGKPNIRLPWLRPGPDTSCGVRAPAISILLAKKRTGTPCRDTGAGVLGPQMLGEPSSLSLFQRQTQIVKAFLSFSAIGPLSKHIPLGCDIDDKLPFPPDDILPGKWWGQPSFCGSGACSEGLVLLLHFLIIFCWDTKPKVPQINSVPCLFHWQVRQKINHRLKETH